MNGAAMVARQPLYGKRGEAAPPGRGASDLFANERLGYP